MTGDEPALRLLHWLAHADGSSLARAAKQLQMGQSELRRLLTVLGDGLHGDGMGLVAVSDAGGPTRLRLTGKGRALIGSADTSHDAAPPLPESRIAVPGLVDVRAERIDAAARAAMTDRVIDETAIALLYNGRPFAVMMATPCDLEDFALGFSLTEGIVAQAGECRLVDRVDDARGIALHLAIPQARYDALQARTRTLAGTSGCGLCGAGTLADALRPVARCADATTWTRAQIADGMRRLAAAQPLNRASGGVHAAGWITTAGCTVREDVGRHNALDKLVGALARSGRDAGFLAITSRASYEIVHKAAAAGIAVVAAVSAPTSLAIATAEQAGITLIGFARGDAMNVYSHAQRIA